MSSVKSDLLCDEGCGQAALEGCVGCGLDFCQDCLDSHACPGGDDYLANEEDREHGG